MRRKTTEENLELTTLFLLDLNTTNKTNDTLISEISVSPPVNSVLHEIYHTYDPFCWRRANDLLAFTCPDDAPERDGLVCYPSCRTGYNGVGPVCWENCENITSIGFACIDIHFSERSCPWYDKCGIVRRACVSCPIRYTKLGCFCGRFYIRSSYGRGVGSSLICSKRYEKVGPFCLRNCPSTHPYSCVTGCSITKETCQQQIKNMTYSFIRTTTVIFNIIMGLSLTSSTSIFDIISNIAKNDWTQIAQNLLILAGKFAEKILPELTNKFLHWSLDKIKSATQNASLIITATAMKNKNLLSPFLKIFHLDSFISTFNHTHCELSNDDLNFD
ncbi:unnamed protein product [Rotaria sp. Silwood1]|nr:unnamed protein product [Rotaria sp. Silwood1]CAF3589215.1 unnamed protein product [Rotaria sp. Silwood1]CAF3593872.1 unnamed protein product [Rotaria sp. Silwood1]CAF4652409.1 unnamed protein product [Rotaria sp. Silwood1]CAF4910830.1 unnamed protein product [Rotaria sp. Silwood1]